MVCQLLDVTVPSELIQLEFDACDTIGDLVEREVCPPRKIRVRVGLRAHATCHAAVRDDATEKTLHVPAPAEQEFHRADDPLFELHSGLV